jgi:hypothetical protein
LGVHLLYKRTERASALLIYSLMRAQCVNTFFSILIFASIGVYGAKSLGGVWETNGRKWSDLAVQNPDGSFLQGYTWDDVCSDWIREKVEIDIFAHVPFKAVPDCGRMANLIHLRCAMEFNLPYALNGKKEFSNSISRFDRIADPQARKWAYMEFINEQPTASSEFIPKDSFPVKINSTTVRPGTLALFLDHPPYNDTYTIKSVSPTGELTFLKGTTNSQTNTLFLARSIEGEPNPRRVEKGAWQDGIRNWRHYDETRGSYIPLSDEKGVDQEEEYSDAFRIFADSLSPSPIRHTWGDAVEHAMQKYEGDIADHIDELQTASCALMINREKIVREGEEKRLKLGRLNPIQYDGFFTPKRDSNLADRLMKLKNFLIATGHTDQKDPYKNYRDSYFAQCAISYGTGPDQIINLAQFQEALLPDDNTASRVSSNANDCLDQKWGVGSCESSIAQNRN